ncbi:hypothetical protein EZS27_038201 [termite gut metagenome]|uniref:Uncharacterized protein n=1 Tax=termite gut metagenome TaxID=433724 RepID=A0A5J4PM01_9ZZZZ
MAKSISLFTARVHDTNNQAVKENQVVILNHTSMTKWVVYKMEHTPKWGYTCHMVSLSEPRFNTATIVAPLREKSGIGWYYDEENPEFMDAFEVAILRQQAQQKADEEATAKSKENERREQVKSMDDCSFNSTLSNTIIKQVTVMLNELTVAKQLTLSFF